MKEYNVKRHYYSVHKGWDDKYPQKSDLRASKLVESLKGLNKQQSIFIKRAVVADAVTGII